MNNSIHITEEEWELIERHLYQQLSAQEQQAFDERMNTDASWRQKVNEVKFLSMGVQEAVLKERIGNFHSAVAMEQDKPVVIKVNWVKRLAIAATLVLGVSALSWLLFFRPGIGERLYADYYKPDPGLATLMGVSDNYEFENAMVNYKTGDYDKALASWTALLKDNPGNDTLHYFIGSAYLAKGEEQKAAPYLDSVIKTPNSVFIQDAKWYKGLLLLKQGRKEEAVKLLKATGHAGKEPLLHKLEE